MEEYAGKKIKYKVKPLEISKTIIPKLDDELAKETGFDSVESLKEVIKKQVESFVENHTVGRAKTEIVETIIKDSKFDIPNSMVLRETDNAFIKTKERLSSGSGIPIEQLNEIEPDMFAQLSGQDPAEFKQMLTGQAINSIKSSLIIEEIAKIEDLKVSEEKFKSFIGKYSEEFKKPVKEIEEMIEKSKSRETIEHDLRIDVVMDYLYDNAKIKKLKPMSLSELLNAK